jgi:hypothetical protein
MYKYNYVFNIEANVGSFLFTKVQRYRFQDTPRSLVPHDHGDQPSERGALSPPFRQLQSREKKRIIFNDKGI